jgi:hypothetical protein
MFKRSGGALQEVEVIKEAVALEPGQSCFELWQGHLGSPLPPNTRFRTEL